jgi:hypothetical protein
MLENMKCSGFQSHIQIMSQLGIIGNFLWANFSVKNFAQSGEVWRTGSWLTMTCSEWKSGIVPTVGIPAALRHPTDSVTASTGLATEKRGTGTQWNHIVPLKENPNSCAPLPKAIWTSLRPSPLPLYTQYGHTVLGAKTSMQMFLRWCPHSWKDQICSEFWTNRSEPEKEEVKKMMKTVIIIIILVRPLQLTKGRISIT